MKLVTEIIFTKMIGKQEYARAISPSQFQENFGLETFFGLENYMFEKKLIAAKPRNFYFAKMEISTC